VKNVVLSFWVFRTTDACPPLAAHTVWPDGCTSLTVMRTPDGTPRVTCVVGGAAPRTVVIHRGTRVFGVRFWPDTGAATLGVPVKELTNGPVPRPFAEAASALLHADNAAGTAEIWRALGEWAVAHLAGREAPDAAVRAAIRAIVSAQGDVRLSDVAAAARVGTRQLQRRFVALTGLTMKEYARVRRLRSVLARRLAPGDEPWAVSAAHAGFADQAHLAREVARLTGLAPTDVERHLERIDHRNVTP
jgi:AraC-like DNA-binding protein